MKFDLSEQTRAALQIRMDEWRAEEHVPDAIKKFYKYADIILALTDKYHALVMNPPYMGSGNMNAELSKYVKDNYEDTKADLCTVFFDVQAERTIKGGYYANIVPPSWMFISSFENLRNKIITGQSIQSLLHLSRGVFGADFGSVSCVIKNIVDESSKGTYFRLVERTFQEFEHYHLQELFENTLRDRQFKFHFTSYTKDVNEIRHSNEGSRIYFGNVKQKDFLKIPGKPLGYWISEKILKAFSITEISKISQSRCGLATGNNDYYIRLWHEVNHVNIGFNYNRSTAKESGLKWFPYNNAGGGRKWYGLVDSIINWEDDGYEMQTKLDPTGKRIWAHNFNLDKIYLPHGGWSDISSRGNYFRFYPSGFLFTSNAVFADPKILPTLIGYGNSNLVQSLIGLLNPTMHFTPGNFNTLPFEIKRFNNDQISDIVDSNISISKADWDAHETSWDFEENELIALQKEGLGTITAGFGDTTVMKYSDLELLYMEYEAKWREKFMQLHANEEELNRQFIEIYGLQDELTPDVPLDEITILQQGEIKIENGEVVFQRDEVMRQFVSYLVGLIMGRYRLDKKGLNIAHPEATDEELASYTYRNGIVEIDGDGILPLMGGDCSFVDNALKRLSELVRVIFGDESHARNMAFINDCLGKSLEDYLTKDFYADHLKRYQKRPIYWLFSSKKGAFKVLAYMHRMDRYTAEMIRNKYLLPHIESQRVAIADLEQRMAVLTTAERKKLEKLRKEHEECIEYHERLHAKADEQIGFDLDDGVVMNYAKFGDVLAKLK
jgi:hypothetical protein